MKILVFSDIHGAIEPLKKMISIFESGNFDLMVIPGDFINHGPRNGLPKSFDQKGVAELLNRYRDKIISCRGNCDSEVDQMLLNFPILNDYTFSFFECGKSSGCDLLRIFVHHGHKAEYSEQNLAHILPPSNETCRTVVVSGHTHIPVLEEKNGFVFLNPGSVTFPKGESKAGYATIDTYTGKIELHAL